MLGRPFVPPVQSARLWLFSRPFPRHPCVVVDRPVCDGPTLVGLKRPRRCVRQAGMTTLLALSAHSTILTGSEPPDWVHLIPAGTFVGVDGRGPYVLRDPQAVIAASMAHGRDLAVDFDHQLVTKKASGGRAPASGWINALEARADGIWGRVEWTDEAAHAIRKKQYRFLSPVFRFDSQTGEVRSLLNAGLVNDPNLELTAVASADPTGDTMSAELLARLRTAFSLPADVTADVVVTHAQALASSVAAHSAQLKTLAGVMKLAETADGAAIAVAAQELVAAGTAEPDPAKFVPMSQFTAVSVELATLRQQESGNTAEIAVNSAMTEGKVTPAMKDWALGYARKDASGFQAWRDRAPVIVAPGPSALAAHAAAPPSAVSGMSATDRVVAAQLGISDTDWAKGG